MKLYYIPRGTQNSFTPVFYGRISPAESGCTITGQFLLHDWVRAFLSVYLGFASCFFVGASAIVGISAVRGSFELQNLLFVGMPLVLIAGAGLVTLVGRFVLGRSNERRVVAFILSAVDAQTERAPVETEWRGKSKLISMYLRL
ncbi:MAG: hypothetical protein JWM98_2072 [Thermoleophilia bacterium]|nr:hypothetical protein [Thermoleophilia bacterium]